MGRRGLALACAVIVAAFAASGCGTTGLPEASNDQRGKELFVERCGSCHVLADAGTQGRIGPNLDDGFGTAREDGLGETTIAAVVRGQISYPVEEPPTGLPGMPADLVTGEDADYVANYVASVAGLPVTAAPGEVASGGESDVGEGEGEAANGEAIFAEAGCGGCHALDAAGASGNVGPSLDDPPPAKELVIDRVTNGKGAMPAFGDSYSEAQIEAVADYVVETAGN